MEHLRQSWQSKLQDLDAQVAELEQKGAAAEATAMRYYRQALSDCLQELEGVSPGPQPKGTPTCWTDYADSLRK